MEWRDHNLSQSCLYRIRDSGCDLIGGPLALAPGQAVLCLGEGAGEGPEGFLGTWHGSCFLMRCSLFTTVTVLAVFLSRRGMDGVSELSNHETIEKTNLKIKNAVQGI